MHRFNQWILRAGLVMGLLSLSLAAAAQPVELLTNPGFEGDYVETDLGGLVAEGWTIWFTGDEADLPEYAPAPETRVRTGDAAQSYSTFLGTHDAGLSQTVSGLTPGAPLNFTVFAYVWSTTDDMNPDVSTEPGSVTLQVGIAADGSVDSTSPTILWSEPVEMYDEYVELNISAAPLGDSVTVFIRSTIAEAILQTSVYLDDASLVLQSEAQAAAPTDVPAAELPTAAPTDEPAAELPTAVPTDEPTAEQPTEVPTVEQPTDIPTEQPTEVTTEEPTPEPTAAPVIELSVLFPDIIEHEVQPGENFTTIAERYGSTADAILAANGFAPDAVIFPGDRLQVPVPASAQQVEPTAVPTEAATAAPEVTAQQITYTLRPGDTLSAVAERYGVSVFELARENRITNWNLVFYGQVLRIPGTGPTPTPTGPTRYTVVPGDNLVKISLRFGVPVARIVEANNIANPNRIRYGQVLTIPND